ATSLSFAPGAVSVSICAPPSNGSPQFAGLSYTEAFPAAFKPRTIAGADPAGTASQNDPSAVYISESGFIFPAPPGAGVADSGTRLKAVFQNLPSGVTLWVSTQTVGASSTNRAQLVYAEVGPYAPVMSTTNLLGIDVVQVPLQNGAAT